MFKPAVIGLTGKKRSGKDTVCHILKNHYGIVRIAFADALKKELAEKLGHTVEFIEEHKEAFRLGLQWYGSEYRRGLFEDDYWIKQAEVKFNRVVNWVPEFTGTEPDAVVFTDCRFPNEAALIKRLGGKLWRVRRDAVEQSGDAHASEHALDGVKVDREILNNGTVEELRGVVLSAFATDLEAR